MTQHEQKEREALLPCPFCGGVPTLEEERNYGVASGQFYIGCLNKCDIGFGWESREAVIVKWNTRHESARTQQAARHESTGVGEAAFEALMNAESYAFNETVPFTAAVAYDAISVYLRTPEQPQEVEVYGDRVLVGGKWFYAHPTAQSDKAEMVEQLARMDKVLDNFEQGVAEFAALPPQRGDSGLVEELERLGTSPTTGRKRGWVMLVDVLSIVRAAQSNTGAA
jgi:Restriction alleviation protein Lar